MKFFHNKNVILNLNTEVPYLTFPALSEVDFIKHGFSTKLGGVSSGIFESMNLGYKTGDNLNNIDENYKRICKSLGFNREDLVLTDQVHDTKIKLVTIEDKGKGMIHERDYQGIDGLITNTIGVPLVTFYADCVPLYFVDIKNHAIGLSHSGWKGTTHKMGLKTLQAMKNNFDTNPKNTIAVIGPSICQSCYEVSDDVAKEFRNAFSKSQISNILLHNNNGKYQLNLWEANRQILLDAGMQDKNIHLSQVCTCCNSDILYSHRATEGKRGALAAFLALQ